MKKLLIRMFICMMGLAGFVNITKLRAQEINFSDLQRAGPSSVKTYPIAGLRSKANELINAFNDSDNSERQSAAESAARYAAETTASQSAATNSGQKNSSSKQPTTTHKSADAGNSSRSNSRSEPPVAQAKTWRCSIYCINASGPMIYRDVQATDRRSAAKQIEENATSYCSASGKKYASSVSYNENQCSLK